MLLSRIFQKSPDSATLNDYSYEILEYSKQNGQFFQDLKSKPMKVAVQYDYI